MSEVISPLVFQLGLGGIGGFVVGYALKKLSKLILIYRAIHTCTYLLGHTRHTQH
jgi:uncharacterized membrane protein (Fun14 family)